MREGEPCSVQERALQPEDRPQVRRDPAPGSAVERVANDRVTDGAQVHPDLVRASRVDRDLGERDALAGAARE